MTDEARLCEARINDLLELVAERELNDENTVGEWAELGKFLDLRRRITAVATKAELVRRGSIRLSEVQALVAAIAAVVREVCSPAEAAIIGNRLAELMGAPALLPAPADGADDTDEADPERVN